MDFGADTSLSPKRQVIAPYRVNRRKSAKLIARYAIILKSRPVIPIPIYLLPLTNNVGVSYYYNIYRWVPTAVHQERFLSLVNNTRILSIDQS